MSKQPPRPPTVLGALMELLAEYVTTTALRLVALISLVVVLVLAVKYIIATIILCIVLLVVIVFAWRGVLRWPLWKSDRPRWQKGLAAILMFGALSILAALLLIAMGSIVFTRFKP